MQQQALKMPVPELHLSEETSPVATVFSSICMFGREAWNACFPDEIETFDYLLAVEEAGIAGFDWRYVVVREGKDIIAAMPAFLCDYGLETTLGAGYIRRAVEKVRGVFKRFLTLRLACLGSPCTETGVIGFHPSIDEARRPALFSLLLDAFEAHARKERCSLMALKDLVQPLPPGIASALSARLYADLGGMPTAWLDIDFKTIDEYFAMLSSATRKDMRRKLRSREKIRVEYRDSFGDLLPRVMQLYLDTRQRSEWQFEELTPDYFDGILKRMPENSFCAMYFAGDELLAANLMIHRGDTLIDKFFCMDAEKGRAHNLYYLSWFTNLDYCLRHGFRRYQSGQAYYRNKVRLGSRLTANAMYFRHRTPLLQFILRKISPLLAADDGAEAMP
ncbi:peptidogalycan biosysnthesis protein [Rhizobium sp. 2MFCol3.1]|uniref:peptidogalycan biosysnthesis protein n=1 Tax=Rhizobium sp. 2MFCol3.1 TaxID=1246459 RepID=UPI0012DD0D07|nr:peptidogalycan biosysnthesis protein [Rhizobium sp. 2MFCol3.1]